MHFNGRVVNVLYPPIFGLFGFIFEVGLVEELVKALPVLAYFVWKKRAKTTP